MPNNHHVDPPPHDPGKPDHPEPERPGEDHLAEPEGWGLDPLVTNPFSPRDDLASLTTQARDLFVLPESVARPPAEPPPEYHAFTQAVTRIQEPFNSSIEGAGSGKEKQKWEEQKATSHTYQACLPDYWRDVVTYMQEYVGRIEDKGKRTEYQAELVEFAKNQDGFLEKLTQWDKERRKYPYDWKVLARLQNELSAELSGYLFRLRQIGVKFEPDKINDKKAREYLDTAIGLAQVCFTSLGFELGRQGNELLKNTTIHYGSASETAASALASTTRQNNLVTQLRNPSNLTKWTNEIDLPQKFSEQNPTRKRWNAEVIEPLKEKTKDWLEASKLDDPDYEELKSAAESLLTESFTQRDNLDNGVIKNIPDSTKIQMRDMLSLLSDVIANRLSEFGDKATLAQKKILHDLMKDIRILRENTNAELLAKDAADQLSKFWSGKKDAVLKEIEGDFPDGGKQLRRQLDAAFGEGLGGLLDRWSNEMKKAPKHSASALHDATWDVRFALRRYRESVTRILAEPVYAEHREQLLAYLDAVQISISNRLRQAYKDGYYLF
jgi:hypothetical protein